MTSVLISDTMTLATWGVFCIQKRKTNILGRWWRFLFRQVITQIRPIHVYWCSLNVLFSSTSTSNQTTFNCYDFITRKYAATCWVNTSFLSTAVLTLAALEYTEQRFKSGHPMNCQCFVSDTSRIYMLCKWGVHVLRYPNFFLGNGSR